MSLQLCSDITEAVEFCERYNLFLKPSWKIKISVQLPVLKSSNQSISSWKVMEKLRSMIKPDEFVSLKVCKTNLVVIQFEGELEKKNVFNKVLQRLQTNSMKLSGFPEVLKIRAAAAKLNYPSRHDWDSFFRDAKNVDEMKPGERPDTVFVQNLPIKWFLEKNCSDKPSEYMLRKVFETFGEVRRLAVPPKQSSVEAFPKVRTFDGELVFDVYVQYKEYISFVKAMDALRGMKLLLKGDNGKSHLADIKVDFDRTRYLSDKAIKLRMLEEKKRKKEKEVELDRKEHSKSKIVEKEEADSMSAPSSFGLSKSEELCQFTTGTSVSLREGEEEKIKKIRAVREKEATHLLKELLHRAEEAELRKKAKEKEEQIAEERKRQQKLLERAQEEERKRKDEEEKLKQKFLQEQERKLREKLLKSLKLKEQKRTEELREKLRKEIAGRKVLKSVLVLAPKKRKSEDLQYASKKFRS